MRKQLVLVVAFLALVSALSVFAQEKPGNVGMVGTLTAKEGAYQKLEEALKAHYQWHRDQKDTYSWFVWEVINGDHVGNFVIGSFGHHWKDLDARADFDKADDADFLPRVLPLVSSISFAYYAMLPEASRPTGGKEPTPMFQLTHFFVKPGGQSEFNDALKEIKVALDKANWPVHSNWYRLVSGGEGPHYVLVTARNSFAEFEPPEKGLEAILTEAYGVAKAAALMKQVLGNTEHVYTEILRYRPDLGYMPAMQ